MRHMVGEEIEREAKASSVPALPTLENLILIPSRTRLGPSPHAASSSPSDACGHERSHETGNVEHTGATECWPPHIHTPPGCSPPSSPSAPPAWLPAAPPSHRSHVSPAAPSDLLRPNGPARCRSLRFRCAQLPASSLFAAIFVTDAYLTRSFVV